MRNCLEKNNVEKPLSETSKNQIEIILSAGRKTIEVRSSCVKNSIDFALFAKSKSKEEEQYFDVIGPYFNGYKSGEIEKNFYMRVLYYCEKKNFLKLLDQLTLKFYITGGATKNMMNDGSIYQINHLILAGDEAEIESDCRVVSLGKSLDIVEFIDAIK